MDMGIALQDTEWGGSAELQTHDGKYWGTYIGGALQGGLGMAASGNLHPGKTSMFEPVHGSAPPLAGKNVANPIGAILSSGLLLETLGRDEDARRIERAVESAVHYREVTRDVGGSLGTREAGDAILRRIR